MIFKNGKVFTEGKFQNYDVRICNGIIEEIGTNLFYKGDEIVDLDGKMLLPGMIDVHTHGRMGVDFTYASTDEILSVSRDYAKQGVTSILATTMTMEMEFSKKMLHRIKNAIEMESDGSRILGINLEGPFLGHKKKGCHDERYLQDVDAKVFEELDNAAGGHVRMVDIDPCYPNSREFIEKYGIHSDKKKIVSIAHTEAGYELACQAVEAGANHVTHLFNAMNSLHHREPGVIGMAFEKPVYAELITDGLHVHEALIRMCFQLIPDKICLISDSLSASGLDEGVYELGGLQVFVKNGKACLKDGTLACSTISVFEGVKRCIGFGAKPEEAILAATRNPARSLGMEDKIGAIQKGLFADLIVADSEFKIEQVYVGGKRVSYGNGVNQ